MSKVDKFWSTFKCIMINNDDIDDGSYFREHRKFYESFCDEGDNEADMTLVEIAASKNMTTREVTFRELTYLESKNVVNIIHTDTIVSTGFLCKYYDISRQAIYKWRKEGCPTVVSTGKMFRYNFIDVQEWINNRGSDE